MASTPGKSYEINSYVYFNFQQNSTFTHPAITCIWFIWTWAHLLHTETTALFKLKQFHYLLLPSAFHDNQQHLSKDVAHYSVNYYNNMMISVNIQISDFSRICRWLLMLALAYFFTNNTNDLVWHAHTLGQVDGCQYVRYMIHFLTSTTSHGDWTKV